VAVMRDRHGGLCIRRAPHTGRDRARRWTLSSDGAGCARRGKTMTALHLSLTLAALFVSSLGAALGLYAAAFIALDNDIDPFMRAIHQQSESAPSPGPAAST